MKGFQTVALKSMHMAEIMYGKPVADRIEQGVRAEIEELSRDHNVIPRLDVVLVGKSAPSLRYVGKKMESCRRMGMYAELHNLDNEVSAQALHDYVRRLGDAAAVHAILVQQPLPRHIEEPSAGLDKFDVFDAIPAEKDVDGISRATVPELYRAQTEKMFHLPATALAVRRMMAFYGIETEGKVAVIVGRNDITAKPIHHMLGGRMCNAAAIWCHRYVKPEDQKRLIREADILVTAVGAAEYEITADMVKPGVAIFDVATRIDAAGKMHGDVDFERVQHMASFIKPVPRGVGPVTVAALCENLLRAGRLAAGAGTPGYVF